jgi:ABC-type transport system substrate-binding protein
MTTTASNRRAARTPLAAGVAVLLALALLAAACGGDDDGESAEGDGTTSTTDAGPPQMGGQIIYGLSAETDGWDPAASRWSPSGLLVANSIFDTLTRFNEDGEIEPYLAESLTPSDDNTEWTIKLRPDVTFHNGEPLNSEAVIKNIQYHRDSNLTGPIFEQIADVQPVDDLTLVVTTQDPFWNFPLALSTQIGVIAAPAMLDSEDRARNPLGTGPFRFVRWTPDASLLVERNEDYWQTDEEGNQLPYLEAIEFQPIPDTTARSAALQAGDIDIAQMSEPVQLSDFEGSEEFNIYVDDTSEQDEVFVMLNTSLPPFDQPIAREALAYGTDRDAVAENVALGLWKPAEGPFRESSRWYTDVEYPAYDPEKATELVEQYESEFGPLEFTINAPPTPFSQQTVTYLDQVWGDLGIDVQIENIEVAQLIAEVITGQYQSVLWQQFGSAHPLLETVWWHCNYVPDEPGQIGLNFARNCNETLSDSLDAARADDDPDNEKGYYDVVQEEIAADLPYIFLMHTDTSIVARKDVISVFDYALPSGSKGLPINNGAHPVQQIWLAS